MSKDDNDSHVFSLTGLFLFVAVEAFVFGTLGLDAIGFGGAEPHVH